MFSKFSDYYFWFTQPSTIFTDPDRMFGYIYAASLILALVLFAWSKFIKHAINKKLVKKFFTLTLNVGIFGLFWLGVRFENTPILAERFWAGLVFLGGFIWLLFILKYLIFNYRTEKIEYDKELVKSKYIPGKR